jgi:enolase
MKVKKLVAKAIKDTRGEQTISIELETNLGKFIASAPNGKSKGEYEARPWKKNINEDIKVVNNYFIEDINLKKFDDLKLIEDDFGDRVGANTMIALEYVFLKALASEEEKEIWQLIKSNAKNIPMPIGNAIGGGVHNKGKKPDFQEFHFIPMPTFERAVEINKKARENCAVILNNVDKDFNRKPNDENAWQTELGDEAVIEIMQDVKENMLNEFGGKIHIGIDVASSEFFKNGKYNYLNPKKIISREEQIKLMIKLSDKLFYIEDPLEQNDFKGFAEIMKKTKSLIVGDDLTATNLDRIMAAVKNKSINAVIIKPNQNGRLSEVKKIVDFCRKNKIKTIFSHRSGETEENILADLAFGFQADFIKTGICGKGREEKLDRMIEIERSL